MQRFPVVPRALAVASALLLIGLGGGCARKGASKGGCAKDNDCKGTRVCEAGRCVDPAGAPAAATAEKSGGKPAPPPVAPGAPGALLPRPSTPGGGSGGAAAGAGDFQVCIGARCIDLGQQLAGGGGQDPTALMDVLKDLMMGGLAGGGSLPDVKLCIQGDCMTLDEKMLKDPSTMMKILGKLGPLMLQGLLGGGGGGGGFPFGGGSAAPSRPRPAPGGAAAFKDLTSLLAAGRDAAGRLAEVGGLTINSVTDTRLVLEGPAQEMIVLTIPASQKAEVPRLRVATQKVAARFQVTGAPVGKLIRGELVSVN